MRKTSGAIVCQNCGKLIDVNEPACPYCGAWRPGLFGFSPSLQRFFGGHFDLIAAIITTCGILFVVSLALEPSAILSQPLSAFFSFLSPGGRALYQLGMTGGLAWSAGYWWTIFTAIYLHGSLLHFLFNAMWIRNLGPGVTEVYGGARAFVIYSLAGAVGFLLSNLVSDHPSIGASGSIFGLMAALIVYGRKRGIHVLTRQLWMWAGINFLFGFMMSGVNNWAHLGGFAGGWATATLLGPADQRRESPAEQLLAVGFIVVTLAGFVLSFVKVTGALMGG